MKCLRPSLTAELVAAASRPVEETDLPHPRMDDAAYRAAAEELLAKRGPGPTWLFAYGSLIWKPDFEHVGHEVATLYGWRRAFCIHLPFWRGTAEEPGLMMALDRGGSCRGVAYRLADGDDLAGIERLLRREVAWVEDLKTVRWVDVRTPDGPRRALIFWAMRPDDRMYLLLPLEDQARRIARAVGHAGSCAEYLFNTLNGLIGMGIHDRYLWALQEAVAQELQSSLAMQMPGAGFNAPPSEVTSSPKTTQRNGADDGLPDAELTNRCEGKSHV